MGKRGSGQGYVPGGHGVKAVQKRDTLQAKLGEQSPVPNERIFRGMTAEQRKITSDLANAIIARRIQEDSIGSNKFIYREGERDYIISKGISSIRVLQLASNRGEKALMDDDYGKNLNLWIPNPLSKAKNLSV